MFHPHLLSLNIYHRIFLLALTSLIFIHLLINLIYHHLSLAIFAL